MLEWKRIVDKKDIKAYRTIDPPGNYLFEFSLACILADISFTLLYILYILFFLV